MFTPYNPNNIFAKIIRKEMPANIVFENDFVIAFKDINPKAKTHILVIPKGNFIDFSHFIKNTSTEMVSIFFQTINHIATDILKLSHFRLQTNNGKDSGQEVFHFHVHILSTEITS